MQRAIFSVFDFDNMLLDTSRLKQDLGNLAHAAFPFVSPDMFLDVYWTYRLHHGGKVHMQRIIEEVAIQSNLSSEDTARLKETWLSTIPYGEYVFPGVRDFIGRLDPERVFIFTKSEDQVYQAEKIETCNLGIAKDHVIIPALKDQEAYQQVFRELKQRGCTDVIYGADEATELLHGYEMAQEFRIGFEGIHHFYGEHRYNGIQETVDTLGDSYHRIDTIDRLGDIFDTIHTRVEGRLMTVEGTGSRKEQH